MKRGLLLTLCSIVALGCLFALGMSGCGGGGGAGGGGTGAPQAVNGTVAIVLADGPAEEFDKIIIRVTEITLLPEDEGKEAVEIYSNAEGMVVDLLELRDEDLILTVNRDVPAGRYSKIRLRVAEVTGEGGPCDHLKLPSGKIDLNPRGAFEVLAGGSISVRLDIDANKSIHIANNKNCNFRPVVFVDIKSSDNVWRCPRLLSGEITALVQDDGETPTEAPEAFMLELGAGRGELEVRLSDDTPIFDGTGDAADWRALEIHKTAQVRGTLDGQGRLVASLVVIGDVSVVKGEALGVVDGQGVFAFKSADGEDILGNFNVLLQDSTLVLANCDQEISPAAIKAGIKCRLVGKYDADAEEFKAVLVFIAPVELSGEITAVAPSAEPAGDAIALRTADNVEVTVFVPAGAAVQLEGDGAVPRELLCAGRHVRVTFDPEVADALEATAVFVRPDRVEGTVASIEAERRVLVLEDGTRIHVRGTATILNQQGDESVPIDFDAIAAGMAVEAFTLAPCSGDEKEGFVIVIRETPLPV